MTHLARLYEEERIEALNIGRREGQLEGLQTGKQETREEIALNMLMSGIDYLQVMRFTGLTRNEIRRLQESIVEEA